MNFQKLTPIVNKPNAWALSPLVVFLCLYLVTSLLINDFYKIPITVAFMVSSMLCRGYDERTELERPLVAILRRGGQQEHHVDDMDFYPGGCFCAVGSGHGGY